MPWLKYAKDCFGNIVDIYNVKDAYITQHGNGSFTCLACGCAVLTKRGKIKEHHFAHVAGQEGKCSYETYLHKLSIIKFIELFKKRVEEKSNFYVEIPRGEICYKHICPYGKSNPCGNVECYERMPLLPDFNKYEQEVRDGRFIPDVLLTAKDGRKIYIEIAVTNLVKESKIESGVPIIEFKINSEKDLSVFEKEILSDKDKLIKLYNFYQCMKDVIYDKCEDDLQNAKNQFVDFFYECKENHLPIIGNYHYFSTCNQNCPYMEGSPCIKKNFKYFDILENYLEMDNIKSNSFTPDLYMRTSTGEKIRFNFVFNLFRKSSPFDNEKTIQFALREYGKEPWLTRKIASNDFDIRYFNFMTSIPENLCEGNGKIFRIIIYHKNGTISLSDFCFIKTIYQKVQNEKEQIDDYILLPADYFFDLHHTIDEVKKIFIKKCKSCVYYNDFGECKKFKRECLNDIAQSCDFFYRDLRIRCGCAYRRQYAGFEDIIEFWSRFRLKL
jgi:hypothetical protein